MELQQDLLAEQKITLDRVITLAVAQETAQRSQEVLNTNKQVAASNKK